MATTDEILYGHDLFGNVAKPGTTGVLSSRFGLPPFSVMDQRSGEWQARKRAWLRLGIKSEIGRGDDLSEIGRGDDPKDSPDGTVLGSLSGRVPDYYWQLEAAKKATGADLSLAEFEADFLTIPDGPLTKTGTSVFDPVLCEMMYRWFCPPGGNVIDPFAGGSVRGIVASGIGLNYSGVELRGDQVAANREQWNEIGPTMGGTVAPRWVEGDAADVMALVPGSYNMALSCPPYGSLERYSDDPRDLSTMTSEEFDEVHAEIIKDTCRMLLPDSFAVWVVGDYRDKKAGHFKGFHMDTIRAFQNAGLHLYNHAVLVSPIGSNAMRATRQFDAARKMVKGHQDVLVFIKGDARAATDRIKAGI